MPAVTESNPSARMADEAAHGRESVLAKRERSTHKSKPKDTGSSFAGTTKPEASAKMTKSKA